MVQDGLNETVFDAPDLRKTAEIGLELSNKLVESESAIIALYVDPFEIRIVYAILNLMKYSENLVKDFTYLKNYWQGE